MSQAAASVKGERATASPAATLDPRIRLRGMVIRPRRLSFAAGRATLTDVARVGIICAPEVGRIRWPDSLGSRECRASGNGQRDSRQDERPAMSGDAVDGRQ